MFFPTRRGWLGAIAVALVALAHPALAQEDAYAAYERALVRFEEIGSIECSAIHDLGAVHVDDADLLPLLHDGSSPPAGRDVDHVLHLHRTALGTLHERFSCVVQRW